MRKYAKVSPRFWTGGLTYKLHDCPEGISLAMYLVTCPESNSIGLYQLHLEVASKRLAVPRPTLARGLKRLCEIGFARYDESTDRVWVVEHMRHQWPGLNKEQRKGVEEQLSDHLISFLVKDFVDLYGDEYSLSTRPSPDPRPTLVRPSVDTETETETDMETDTPCSPPSGDATNGSKPSRPSRKFLDWCVARIWEDHLKQWKAFYEHENGVTPAPVPTLDDSLAKIIRDATLRKDKQLVLREDEERFVAESWSRASGIGIFLDPWCTGKDKGNNVAAGEGRRYLEHWRPWREQRGKGDPVEKYGQLYFEAKSREVRRVRANG